MKRKGYFLLLAALLCASALQAQFRRGDVNGDLNVDVADISTILSIMAGEGGGYEDTYVRYGKEYVVAADGSGDYTSLIRCLMEHENEKNIVIRLMPGTYNMIEEMKDWYGPNFWETYRREMSGPYFYGPALKNGVTIIGCANALVTCHYRGQNANVMTYFSPFNNSPFAGGFTLRGVNLECSNVRYAVHDEIAGSDVPNKVTYDGCSIKIDNAGNTAWPYGRCIGGGLGVNSEIRIVNCHFESLGVNDRGAVVYHNSSGENAKSLIICGNNYVAGHQGFRFRYYGPSTRMTRVLCMNNCVGMATILDGEAGAKIENIELLDWGNVVRE